MAAPLIEHSFTATGQSPAVLGYELGRNEPHNYTGLKSSKAAWQVVQTSGTGTFTARLQRGIRRSGAAITWDDTGTADVTVSGTVTDFDLVPGAEYRFDVEITGTATVVVVLN